MLMTVVAAVDQGVAFARVLWLPWLVAAVWILSFRFGGDGCAFFKGFLASLLGVG